MSKSKGSVHPAASSDPETFEPMVRAMSPRLYRLALRILGRASDAEDALQEAFVRAYDALATGRYQEHDKMEAWLVRIVTRVSIDSLRARRTREPMATEEELAELAAAGLGEDQAHAVLELSMLLGVLAPEQRAAVVLRFVEGMTSAEVASALETSEGAVEQRIIRARAALRKRSSEDVDA